MSIACFHLKVSLCAANQVNQTVGALNATIAPKTVKATDFKFDAHVSTDSPDMIY